MKSLHSQVVENLIWWQRHNDFVKLKNIFTQIKESKNNGSAFGSVLK